MAHPLTIAKSITERQLNGHSSARAAQRHLYYKSQLLGDGRHHSLSSPGTSSTTQAAQQMSNCRNRYLGSHRHSHRLPPELRTIVRNSNSKENHHGAVNCRTDLTRRPSRTRRTSRTRWASGPRRTRRPWRTRRLITRTGHAGGRALMGLTESQPQLGGSVRVVCSVGGNLGRACRSSDKERLE